MDEGYPELGGNLRLEVCLVFIYVKEAIREWTN